MQTNGLQPTQSEHPPLARDAQGNLLEVPDGTAAWRVCRQTTGRPRVIVGPDRQPMRFPLEITNEELVDLCGPDVYRIYALDEVGKVLDYVTTIDVNRDVREPRNAMGLDTALPSLRATQVGTSGDLRFALETIAQIARVNSEALRSVAASQADWVKSIASARGFFRNSHVPTPNVVEEAPETDDVEEPRNKTIYDVLAPLAEHWGPSVKPLVSMLTSGPTGGSRNAATGAPTEGASRGGDLEKAPNWEFRDLIDLNYAASKAKAKKAKHSMEARKESLQARLVSDPKLLSHFMAIKELLQPEEVARILALGESTTDEQLQWLIEQVSALPVEAAAALLRNTLVELDQMKFTTATE